MIKKLYIYAAAASMLAAATGCQDNYLDTAPTNQVAESTIFTDYESLKMAVNGCALLMHRQYGYNDREQTLSGEGSIHFLQGEMPGQDFQKPLWTGWSPLANMSFVDADAQVQLTFGWIYPYRIIANANNIIANLDRASATEKEKAFIKAQALTFRAYFYNMLVQLYSRRWTDANGRQRGVILRLTPSNDPMPCSTLQECMDQIYADLDEAISLYQQSGMNRDKDEYWLPNIDVARSVYARAALVKNDWAKAYEMAKAARQGYDVMGPDEYAAGFNTENGEWIWGVYDSDLETIYYHSFHAYIASNSAASAVRSYPPCISKNLFDAIPEGDVRRELYAYPLDTEKYVDGKTTWNNTSQILTTTAGKAMKKRIVDKFGSRINPQAKYCVYHATKFQVRGSSNGGALNIFRGAEMIYNQAEAAYMMGGKEAEIRQLLEEAVRPYNPDYTCTKSGAELLDEIKLYRRFDLWGEGLSWFDMKRWGQRAVRKSWKDGGSFSEKFCGSGENGGDGGNFGPTDRNNWTYVIPRKETDYNPLVTKYEEIASDGSWNKAAQDSSEK